MLNDRLNGGARNDLRSRLRDKKFVSMMAIAIFVLILFFVLIAKGCNSRKRKAAVNVASTQSEVVTPPVAEPAASAPAAFDAPAPFVQQNAADKWLELGKCYMNGDGGAKKDLVKAERCFLEAAAEFRGLHDPEGEKSAKAAADVCKKLRPRPAAPKAPAKKPAKPSVRRR